MPDQPVLKNLATTVAPDGATAAIDWRAASEPAEGWVWAHLDRNDADVAHWLLEKSGAPQDVSWALLEEDTQPRARAVDHGVLLVLRSVNLNPGAAPEDMISVRLYVTERRVISVSQRPLRAIQDMTDRAAGGDFPATPATFVTRLVEDVRARAEPVLDTFQAQLETLEDVSFEREFTSQDRRDLNMLRRAASHTRRHIGPQARALVSLVALAPRWLPSEQRDTLHEEAAAFDRMAGDLDSVLDRAAILRDEVDTKIAERANRILLLFSIVGAVFLPLTFLTGLLGVNLAGIPNADSQWAFAGLAAILLVLGIAEVLVIRWLKLF